MTKVIKEIIIMLLICLIGILLFAVAFYQYAPSRKIVPEVIEYKVSEIVSQQLNDNVEERDDKIIKTYEVTSSELNNFKKIKDYVPGKENPFASVVENPEIGATTNSNGNSDDNSGETQKVETNTTNNKSNDSTNANIK